MATDPSTRFLLLITLVGRWVVNLEADTNSTDHQDHDARRQAFDQDVLAHIDKARYARHGLRPGGHLPVKITQYGGFTRRISRLDLSIGNV